MSKITTEIAKKALRDLGYNLGKLPFSLEDFTFGMNIELEHGKHDKETNVSDDDPKITAKITLAHLKESPLYYKELKKMESRLEKKADEIISCMEKCAKKKSPFQRLRDNQVPFTREEAGIARAKKAVWNDGSHAVWKSENSKTGEVTYITNTHRCYQTAPTLKGAISKFHNFVKRTASSRYADAIEKVAISGLRLQNK